MNIATALKRNTMKGGAIAARILAQAGVTRAFGIVDGTYLGICSGFRDEAIRLITPRHETTAMHMAGAYARATGTIGICIASNGPGVANVLPGVAVENAEGNRVLLITSSRRSGVMYPDRGGAYQCFDQVAVTKPMTKWSCAVPSVDRLPELLRRALHIAHCGRPGVVHLDVPESILNGEFEVGPRWLEAPSINVEGPSPSNKQIEAAIEILASAKRPVIHAGSGVLHAGAYAALANLAERIEAPVTTSWGARGVIDERSRHSVPMIHVDAVNLARSNADVVLVLGSRLGETDWWAKAPYWGRPETQRMIQVDLEAETIGAHRPVDLAVQADVSAFMAALLDRLGPARAVPHRVDRRRFVSQVRGACVKNRAKLDEKLENKSAPMVSAHVPTECRQAFGDDAICVLDGGNTAVWGSFYHEVRAPNTILSTPKMGMLGAGVAQALGAKVAHPGRDVYCIIGDGAMGFHPQEIETAIRNELPVIFLVLCDKQWGMVKMNQQFALKPIKTLVMKSLSPEETINTDLGEIEFDKLAESMGAHGERVRDPADLRGAIDRCKASGRCAVIHVDVDPVQHMWAPALRVFKAMHEEPKG